MNRLLILLLFLLLIRPAGGADLYVPLQNLRQQPSSRTALTLTPLEGSRNSGSALIEQRPVSAVTTTNGTWTFTNVLWGRYRLDAAGAPSSSWTFEVPNTNILVDVTTLIGNTNAPNPRTNYWTAAQTAAAITGATNGITGGSGTAGTNYTIYNTNLPAGVVDTNGFTLGVGTNNTAIYSKIDTNTANLRPGISDRRMTVRDFALSQGLPFTLGATNSRPLLNGSAGFLAHGTTLQRYNGTNYFFVIGRSTPATLRRIECDHPENSVDLVFTNDLRHGAAAGFGADTVTPWRDKLIVAFNDANSANTNLTVAEVNPLTMTATDVITTNLVYGLTAVSFNIEGVCATDTELFIASSGNNGATWWVFSITNNYSLVWSTNVVNPPPVAFPGFLHAMGFDGEFVWGTGYSANPGAVRINPVTRAIDIVSLTNSPTSPIIGVPMNDGNGAGISTPTDDLAFFGNYVYIGTEDTNGIITRIHRNTLAVDRIRTGADGNNFGVFSIGDFVYATYPGTYSTPSNGTIVRINPATLQIDHFRAPYSVNELHSDGQSFYGTTYSGNTNVSVFFKIPVLENVTNDTYWAATDGSFRMTLKGGRINDDPNLRGAMFGPVNEATNTSRLGGIAAADYPTNRQISATLGGFEYVVNTNRLQIWGASIAAANGTFIYTNTAYHKNGDPSLTQFITNVSASPIIWDEWTGGTRRYFITNPTPSGTNWFAVSGTPPQTTFHADGVYRGDVTFTNLLIARAANFGSVTSSVAVVSGIMAAGYLYGDASNASNYNASNLTGTAPLSVLPSAVVTNGMSGVSLVNLAVPVPGGYLIITNAGLNPIILTNTTGKYFQVDSNGSLALSGGITVASGGVTSSSGTIAGANLSAGGWIRWNVNGSVYGHNSAAGVLKLTTDSTATNSSVTLQSSNFLANGNISAALNITNGVVTWLGQTNGSAATVTNQGFLLFISGGVTNAIPYGRWAP